MADWARSLQQGFQTGLQLGQTLRQRRLEEALAEEAAKYAPTEVASGEEALRGFREGTAQTGAFTMPDGTTITPAQYEQQYLGGLQQRPAGYTVGGQDYASLAAAEQAAAVPRAAGLANVYRQFGDVAKAEEMMGLSRQTELQNLQIAGAKRAEEDALKVRTATEQIAQLGRTPTLEEVRQIASANKLSLDQQFKLGESITGIATQDAKMLEMDIKKKIKGKNLDSLLKLHKDDPAFDDNSFFEKSVDKDGKVTLTQKSNDGTILSTQSFSSAEAATKYLNEAAVDPANLYTWLQTNRLNEAKLAESQANVGLAQARAAALPGATSADTLRQNIALADQYRKQLSDIDAQLNSGFYPEGSEGFTALLAQRNAINRSLTDVNRLLQPGGLTRGGAQAPTPTPAPNVEAAREVARSGINPDTGKAFTDAEKKEYQRIFGEPFPEAAPAQPPKPASPRAARAAREDTIPPAPPQTITTRGGVTRANPEYADWLKKYGSRLGLQ